MHFVLTKRIVWCIMTNKIRYNIYTYAGQAAFVLIVVR